MGVWKYIESGFVNHTDIQGGEGWVQDDSHFSLAICRCAKTLTGRSEDIKQPIFSSFDFRQA